jgi:hypothetical protein
MTDLTPPAAAPSSSTEEDPELLALGEQLDQVEQRWKDRRIKDILDQEEDPELEIWTSIHGQLYPVAGRILQRKALTRLGLAIQARATSMVFSEYWMPEFYDKDGVEGYIRLFVEAACAFAGTLPVPISAQRVVNPKAFPVAAERVVSDEAADRAKRT